MVTVSVLALVPSALIRLGEKFLETVNALKLICAEAAIPPALVSAPKAVHGAGMPLQLVMSVPRMLLVYWPGVVLVTWAVIVQVWPPALPDVLAGILAPVNVSVLAVTLTVPPAQVVCTLLNDRCVSKVSDRLTPCAGDSVL